MVTCDLLASMETLRSFAVESVWVVVVLRAT